MKSKDIILSIGIGPGQLDFIKRIKKEGYCVAGFGKGKNSEEAINLCDYVAEIDTRDFESAVRWIESLDVNVIAVGSFAGGEAVTTVQKLANYFRTPTAVPDFLIVGSNKIIQQNLYNSLGISSIRTWKAKDVSIEEVSHLPDEELFICKPTIGRGSEGITIVDKKELTKRLNDGIFGDDDIIQIVRKGEEYRCVLIVQDGEIKLLAPILRKSYRDTVFLGILRYSDKHIERMITFFEEFIKSANLKNTIIKSDVIVSDNRIDVIEMDIGVGGGSYYKKYVSRVYDRDLTGEYIKLITNTKVEKFNVAFPHMRMDYVFNHKKNPVTYNLNECYKVFEEKLGKCEIQINSLHPEEKGGFNSNADFIFTVMYENSDLNDNFIADDIANELLLN